MEKVLLFRRSPLFASPFALNHRLLSGVNSEADRTEVQPLAATPPGKRQGGKYPGVSVLDLIRGWLLYNLFRSDYLVDNSLQIIKRAKSLLGWPLTEKLLKATIFSQFVAEDTDKALSRKVQLYDERRVGVVFAYISEPLEEDTIRGHGLTPEEESELQEAKHSLKCAKCLESIDNAAHYVKGRPRIAAMKISFMVDPKLLERLTTLLNYSDQVFASQCAMTSCKQFPAISTVDMVHYPSDPHQPGPIYFLTPRKCGIFGICCEAIPRQHFQSRALQHTGTQLANKKGEVDIIDWQNHFSVHNLEQLHLVLEEELSGVKRPPSFSLHEHKQIKDLMKHLNNLGERAATKNVRLLVDAEQTYYQPAIRSLVVHYLMETYNKDQPIIYNTLQSYLKSSYQMLLMEHATAKRNNSIYAVKVVRGAYMDEERRLALEQSHEDPIHDNKMATDCSYDRNIEYLLSHNDCFLFVASHNLQSVLVAKKQMLMRGVSAQSDRVVFGQLLGMADHISLPLAQKGYHVYKLLHYGDVRNVVPYLARRALENRGVMSTARDEQKLLGKEIRQKILSLRQ